MKFIFQFLDWHSICYFYKERITNGFEEGKNENSDPETAATR